MFSNLFKKPAFSTADLEKDANEYIKERSKYVNDQMAVNNITATDNYDAVWDKFSGNWDFANKNKADAINTWLKSAEFQQQKAAQAQLYGEPEVGALYGGSRKVVHKGRSYKVHVGPRGGKYIVCKKEKIYV